MGSHVVDFIDLTGDMEIEDDLVSDNIFFLTKFFFHAS